MRSGFVQDENGSIFQESARDSDALSLSAAQLEAAFSEYGVISLRQVLDKFVGQGGLCGTADGLPADLGPAVGDVACRRIVKQKSVLRYQADLLAQRGDRE